MPRIGRHLDFDDKPWEEVVPTLPPVPGDDKLAEFYVGSLTRNRFFIEPASVDLGSDGVVRYTLVVRTEAGAKNVSYEGLRCATRELRRYAFGRTDGSWAKARSDKWTRVYNSDLNRHHAALMQEVFCPDGIVVTKREDALESLRRAAPR
ncbi:MAG: CNP1-like family protein [Betaproteobacteria bacterium]|nr:CNP1-like family protein [Betaproteobacteria bacterium]